MVELKGKPVDKCIIQVFMPTTERSQEEADGMFEKTEQLLDDETRGKDMPLPQTDVVGLGQMLWAFVMVHQQEAQLMLTTGAMRLAVSRGQQTWYHFGSVATFR